MKQIKTDTMMKRLVIMAVLITGLILTGTSLTNAQDCFRMNDTTSDEQESSAEEQIPSDEEQEKIAEEQEKRALANRDCWAKKAKAGEKDLHWSDLAGLDMQNVDLTDADLTNAQIVSANFSGANFSGANLTNANLSGTNFTGANFTKANLTDAGFASTDLTNTDFTGANMNGISFLGGAKIGGAKIDLTQSECKVTTNGEDLNIEGSNGKVYGSLKNGTIVYKDGNDQPWDKGRISVNEKKGDELTGGGLVDGKFLTCNTPTKVTSDKTINCKVRTRGANLNARSLEGKLLFTIENNSGVYVFEQSEDGRAKVSVFNGEMSKGWTGWVPRKYLKCDGD